MAQGVITTNTSTPWYTVKGHGCHIGVSGDLGGGSIAVEQNIAGEVAPLLDGGEAVVLTGLDDSGYLLNQDDEIRLTVTGATNPRIPWKISGVEKSFRTTNPNR